MYNPLPLSVAAAAAMASRRFSRWDALAVLVAFGIFAFLGTAGQHLAEPLSKLDMQPVTVDPALLPEYAARTALRMLSALVLSLMFTLSYATLAAKSRKAEQLLIPVLDILQSVPILGFISITVVFFLSLAPGKILGAEFAAIFAIFTSQAWNMTFSFYQSLRTVPVELTEAARSLRLSPWMRFWRLEVPFAMPGLIWNMMMSMSGGWFFVVASEAISVGQTTITLPGIGSYIALAIEKRDLTAILWAILAMAIVILIFDQVLFRPLVAWADRFRAEQQSGVEAPRSWMLDTLRRSWIVSLLGKMVGLLSQRLSSLVAAQQPSKLMAELPRVELPAGTGETVWRLFLGALILWAVWSLFDYLRPGLEFGRVLHVVGLAVLTLLRVAVLLLIASVIWVPISIWVGLRPKLARVVQPLAQLAAAFPANLFFPIAVFLIVHFNLNPDIWLSPLMILGTQWYIVFNVIAGAVAIPSELRDVGSNMGLKGWLWLRKSALPAVFPYYLTGAITAAGGSLNASIVAEYVSWGDVKLQANGLGAYIAKATADGNFPDIVLGIAVMSTLVVLLNRLFWRPLYNLAERRFRFD